MVGQCVGAVLNGLTGNTVSVEADISNGLPTFNIVGLPDVAVNESKLRIRSAIRNGGMTFPSQRITVNLSPASMRKRGAGLDLPIAIAILAASGLVPQHLCESLAFCAELSLSGQLVPIPGIVPLALALREDGIRAAIVADSQRQDCIRIDNFEWFPLSSLSEVVSTIRTQNFPAPWITSTNFTDSASFDVDFSEVQGMGHEKRLLTIAAVGSHHTLLVGPPGAGKTMLAERLATILPDLTYEQSLETFSIHQSAGIPLAPTCRPPVRIPHHSLTVAGMIGGGNPVSPGETTLSHNGVLFLDEVLEFHRTALDALREPLVNQHVRLTRNGQSVQLPSAFQLIGTLNPCPCGQYGFGECRCSIREVRRYWSRLSGPLLDRMEMVINVDHRKQSAESEGESTSADIRAIVTQKRRELSERMLELAQHEKDTMYDLHPQSRAQITKLLESGALSKRGFHHLVKLARTISVVDDASLVLPPHLNEAWGLRPTPVL